MIENYVIKKILYENEFLTIMADVNGREEIIRANINEINIIYKAPSINIEAYYNTFSIEKTANKQCNVSFEDLLFGTERR